MPLIKSASPKIVGENIKREVAAGKPRRQAIAIALDVQRRAKMADGGSVPFFAKSGLHQIERSGMVHSPTGGRADQVPASVRSGSYIMPADVVSGIGKGNSLNGADTLNRMFKTGPYNVAMPHPKMGGGMKIPTAGMMKGRKGFADGGDVGKPVDVSVSGGEFVLDPAKVAEIGGGDIDHGHNILDKMVEHIRKKTIKTLRRLPKPKV